ncbi:MAG: Tm-1-like ATP-binding domain-containing protein [Acidobacteria bacterium]|nr:Tm-1-like ATP-binding domain-containing protein [Acidobacteriota bacterium]
MAKKVIAVLATLDTKGQEAAFLREQLEALGSGALLVDIGVMDAPATRADVTRSQVARAGGASLKALQAGKSRETSQPVMAAGATRILLKRLQAGEVHGVIGLGGLQGTAACTAVMRALPYGVPKVMVSTVASGDTSSYVGISDITMMFSVGDIIGLNTFMRKVLANAAGAAHGMAQVGVSLRTRARGGKPLIGISNLGVLTRGTLHALERFRARGYEAIVFHAVGTGGRAMELMMKQGIIGAVFDYAMGEISDELFHALRAGGQERLTVAGALGLPQVLVPGGSEHLGILVSTPHQLPERWKDHRHVWHNEVVLAPRLNAKELRTVAREVGRRLQHTRGNAVLMIPTLGTGSYAMPGGPLNDPKGDAAYFAALKKAMPSTIEIVERPLHAEDPMFVDEAVDRLIALVERQQAGRRRPVARASRKTKRT